MNSRKNSSGIKPIQTNLVSSKSGFFPQHRAIRSYKFPKSNLVEMILIPILFSLVLYMLFDYFVTGWSNFFEFWVGKLALSVSVITKSYGLGWLTLTLPFLDYPSVLPSTIIWKVIFMITMAAILISYLLPAKLLPLSYLLRVTAIIQLTAQAFFWWNSENYLYSASGQTESLMIFTVLLMFLVPWVHALTYYIFNFTRTQKVLFTLLTLLMLLVFSPFQLMLHTYLLINYSLLLMPLLFFLFGVLIPIMICIALYGWAMSWERRQAS